MKSLSSLSLPFSPFRQADAGAAGAPPASTTPPASAGPGAPPTSPAAAPAGAKAPGAPDLAAIVAEAVKAQVTPLLAQLQAKDAEIATFKTTAEKSAAEKASEAAKAATAEEQVKLLRDRFNRTTIDAAVQSAAGKFTFVSPDARELAINAFAGQSKIEVRDSGEILAVAAGKSGSVETAFAAWMERFGAPLKAAAAQPGAGTLPGAPPTGTAQIKRPKDMTDAEFREAWTSGKMPDGTPIEGSLTPGGPKFNMQNQQNPYAARRVEVNTAFKALAGQQKYERRGG